MIGSIFAALYVGHTVADHWLQTDTQARTKGEPGLHGALVCAGHALIVTLFKVLTLWSLAMVTGWRPGLTRTIIVLAIVGASHWLIDRRKPLRDLAVYMGKGPFYDLGDSEKAPTGTGRYTLDQAAHLLVIWLAALAIYP